MASWSEGPFLISAAPGAGKTHPSLVFAAQEIRAGRARRVAVLCPTTPLTRQWARAATRVGLHLEPDASTLRPPGDFQGVALTYARVATSPEQYAKTCSPGTLVIADEAHHLGDDLAWGDGFRAAFGAARRWLLLSGTPFRSDQTPIPGVRYDDGVAVPDVSYTYAEAVRDGVCRRAAFVPYDGSDLIADEAHHLGDDLAWGDGFRAAFGAARRWLLLSGTPFRSDQTPIPGVRYDDGVAVPDVSYTYAEAVRDGVCRRVAFVPYDGTLQWQSGDDVIETSFDEVLSTREAGRRYRTAISTELPDGLPRILRAAHARLLEVRQAGHRDAGGLVVTADSEHARAVAKAMREITGTAPTVVLHTEAGAHRKLDAFRRSTEPWIVAVNMVSEGVDIPRLRVGVYATVAKTPLIFRQIVGRFVRVVPGRSAEISHVFLPADTGLR